MLCVQSRIARRALATAGSGGSLATQATPPAFLHCIANRLQPVVITETQHPAQLSGLHSDVLSPQEIQNAVDLLQPHFDGLLLTPLNRLLLNESYVQSILDFGRDLG
jgi:hypothetical protein